MPRKFSSIDSALEEAARILSVKANELRNLKPIETQLDFDMHSEPVYLYTLDSELKERSKIYRIAVSKSMPCSLWIQYIDNSFRIQ